MFSSELKQEISEAVQKILKDTKHGELPVAGEISFLLHVDGEGYDSWANIRNRSKKHIGVLPSLRRNTTKW